MSFVSYAQNYEDVMLIRAFRHVERGFYIDVGAQDPVNDSVTKAFYDLGWRGINIEPVTYWLNRLVAARRHDINLQVAVSDRPGELHLFEVVDSGLSTTDADFAARHLSTGHQIRESDVKCVTLTEICHAHNVGDIHFLKVDCEGGEAAALRGLDFNKIRPWVLLIEATEPNSQKPAYEEWEPMVLEQGYEFVYQDGLNRFYVAAERSELKAAFSYPPNVFDYFVRASEAEVREDLQSVQVRVAELREVRDAAQAKAETAALEKGLDHLRSENERREEALVQLRSALGRADEREADMAARRQVERDQWRADVEWLRVENDRREAALVHLREAVEDANERKTLVKRLEQTVLVQEAELTSVKQEMVVLIGQLDSSKSSADRLETALLGMRRDFEHASSGKIEMEREVGRLHYEVMLRDQEVARLQKLTKLVFGSTSWRITSPLRLAKHGITGVSRLLSRGVFQMVRGPARFLRPLLRWLALWSWVRAVAVLILGRDSALVQHARLFLMVGEPRSECNGKTKSADPLSPLTRQASLILEEIHLLNEGSNRSTRP